MPRYQTESQRASGDSSASANGCVSEGSSNSPALRASTPNSATAASATTSTRPRLATNAKLAERSAVGTRRCDIACVAAMAIADLPIAASFWSEHRGAITAVITVVLAFVLAQLVDRAISG